MRLRSHWHLSLHELGYRETEAKLFFVGPYRVKDRTKVAVREILIGYIGKKKWPEVN